ncbi:MAG: family 1 glycosylhydrolase [Chloroflexi bacterium]|nr:family 1 glycosylhydrolase [Chloroflexota bacterium]MCL5275447.1 family 1 glycosylhydrolase [Chloroflexota bacterium]
MADATFYFPDDFKWGAATAAHQVEGNNTNNQWWAWEQAPGHIRNGDKSGDACGWWLDAEADFDRMVDLGLNAHRLSIEWSRIEPREGQFDTAAIDRYRAMLLGLRRRGIEPMVTLHHFTNPQWLEERGGWEHAHVVVPLFVRYAARVVKSMGDLCDLWCTINEPNVYATLGYLVDGRMPPGMTNRLDKAMAVMCNMLLGHAAAYQVLHEHQALARVGFAHHMRLFQPLNPASMLDRTAARLLDGAFNRDSLTALLKGRWSLAMLRGRPPSPRPLRGTLDWIGVNYYGRQGVAFDSASPGTLWGRQVTIPGAEMSDFDTGDVYPEGITPLLKYLVLSRLPVYITENGLPDADDHLRPGFILRELRALWSAVQFQLIQGYYHWTLTDNFEWADGWRLKFGLYQFDPLTGERTPRRSAMLYRDIIRKNAINGDIVREYAPDVVEKLFP